LLCSACTSTNEETTSSSTSANPVITASAGPAEPDAAEVTLTLQKLDISTQPLDQPFDVTVSIHKDQANTVTIDIPSIVQQFASSEKSPNADPGKPFPAFWEPTTAATKTDSHAYVPLPAGYPLGGYIDTVADNIPEQFRPTGGLPVTFPVAANNASGPRYTGSVDNKGRLQFAGPDELPIGVGPFESAPTSVTYTIEPSP